jgi:hypothetical protein
MSNTMFTATLSSNSGDAERITAFPAKDCKAKEPTQQKARSGWKIKHQTNLSLQNVHEILVDQLQNGLKQLGMVAGVRVKTLHHVLACVTNNVSG